MNLFKRSPTPSEIAAYIEANPERVSTIYRTHLAKQSKGNLEAAFHDDKGRIWYTFKDKDYIPAERVAELTTQIAYLTAGLSGKTFETAFEAFNTAIAHGQVVEAGAIIHQLRQLPTRIVNFDSMVNVLALNYIREDEDPNVFNKTIHGEKCDFLWTETKDGRFFFRLPKLVSLLGSEMTSSDTLTQSLADYQAELKRLERNLSILTQPKQ